MVSWLAGRTVDDVRAGLRTVAPELADGVIELHDSWVDTGNPLWSRSSAFVDGTWVVKFAWSEAAATKLIREADVIEAVAVAPAGPPVARIVARSAEPAMFVSRFQTGRPLAFEHTAALDLAARRAIADGLAGALAALHRPATFAAIDRLAADLPPPTPQASTVELRVRFVPLLDTRQAALVSRWCDWADDVLREPVEPVLLHGDFHGYNVVFDDDWRVVRVLDFEESSIGDPHYDFRYLPAQEATLALYRFTVDAYERAAGRAVDHRRVMAWHMRTVCGDALWRTEAEVALPGGGNPQQWIDELAERFAALSIAV